MIAKMIIDIKFRPFFVFPSKNWANHIHFLFAFYFLHWRSDFITNVQFEHFFWRGPLKYQSCIVRPCMFGEKSGKDCVCFITHTIQMPSIILMRWKEREKIHKNQKQNSHFINKSRRLAFARFSPFAGFVCVFNRSLPKQCSHSVTQSIQIYCAKKKTLSSKSHSLEM